VLAHPEFRNATASALTDVDGERPGTSEIVAVGLAAAHGSRARVDATLGRRAALDGAEDVVTSRQVGALHAATIVDVQVPRRYGVRQTIAESIPPLGPAPRDAAGAHPAA
jgi:alpha-galactosidase